jgi:hypothetical protein
MILRREWNTEVDITTGYGLKVRSWISNSNRSEIFLFSKLSRTFLGPNQPPIELVSRALSPGVKLPGLEADHSPPTRAEVKNTWIYTSTHSYAFRD